MFPIMSQTLCLKWWDTRYHRNCNRLKHVVFFSNHPVIDVMPIAVEKNSRRPTWNTSPKWRLDKLIGFASFFNTKKKKHHLRNIHLRSCMIHTVFCFFFGAFSTNFAWRKPAVQFKGSTATQNVGFPFGGLLIGFLCLKISCWIFEVSFDHVGSS